MGLGWAGRPGPQQASGSPGTNSVTWPPLPRVRPLHTPRFCLHPSSQSFVPCAPVAPTPSQTLGITRTPHTQAACPRLRGTPLSPHRPTPRPYHGHADRGNPLPTDLTVGSAPEDTAAHHAYVITGVVGALLFRTDGGDPAWVTRGSEVTRERPAWGAEGPGSPATPGVCPAPPFTGLRKPTSSANRCRGPPGRDLRLKSHHPLLLAAWGLDTPAWTGHASLRPQTCPWTLLSRCFAPRRGSATWTQT